MANPTNLSEVILQESCQLFRDQGYTATTIKQIAKAAGCTTAALYYYFEGGKSEILHEVIRSFRGTDDLLVDADMEACHSLPEFIEKLTTVLTPAVEHMADEIGWILLQFPSLPEEEKKTMQARILETHTLLKKQIGCFTTDETEAEQLAWMIFNVFFGYQQVFFRAEIGERIDFDVQAYGHLLARLFEAYISQPAELVDAGQSS